MREHRWVCITACENVPLREGRAVDVGGRQIALFNLGDGFIATENQCPHQGGPLCDGIITGRSVVCPLHGWKVNLGNGAVERPAAAGSRCIRTFPTRVEDGIVSVELPESFTIV